MQKDPIGFGGGDTNLYRYVGNDPVNYIDRTGKAAETAGGGWGRSTAFDVQTTNVIYGIFPPTPAQQAQYDRASRGLRQIATVGAGVALAVPAAAYAGPALISACMMNPNACVDSGVGFVNGFLDGLDGISGSTIPQSFPEAVGSAAGQVCGEGINR